MQHPLQALLDRRCKRAIAVILGVAERELYPSLTAEQQRKLRKVVIDVLHDYKGMLEDVADALDTGDVQLNSIYLDKIDEIWSHVVEPASRPEPRVRARSEHRSPAEFGGGRPVAAP